MRNLAGFIFVISTVFLTNAFPTRFPDNRSPLVDQYLLSPDAFNFSTLVNECQDPGRKEIIDKELAFTRLIAKTSGSQGSLTADNPYVVAFVPEAYRGAMRLYEEAFQKMHELDWTKLRATCSEIRDCVDHPGTVAWTDGGLVPPTINFCNLWFTNFRASREMYDDCVQNKDTPRTLSSLDCRGK